MAVKITTEKIREREEILKDLIRLGKRGGFFQEEIEKVQIPNDLLSGSEQVVSDLSARLSERLHNPKNYMMACVSFAMYIGMGGYFLRNREPEETAQKGVLESLLFRSDLLLIDAYVSDLTGLDEDQAYAGKFKDFLGLFQTRALMLCCGNDLEKLNNATCHEATAAMYRLGMLVQAVRMQKSH